MDLGIGGKHALVLASSRGLGLGVATALCREGAHVLLSGRSENDLADAAASLTDSGPGKATWTIADLTHPDVAANLFAAAEDKLGGVDILVNNTGGPPPGQVDTPDIETWRSQIETMLLRVIEITNLCVPGMKAAGWGRILTIASSGVIQPIQGIAMSNTIRSALVGWNKTLSNEIAGHGITVNILAPGRIRTARTTELDAMDSADAGISIEDIEAASCRTIPTGRYGTVDEFGAVGAFLASAPASYVSGSVIRCDGGSIRSV